MNETFYRLENISTTNENEQETKNGKTKELAITFFSQFFLTGDLPSHGHQEHLENEMCLCKLFVSQR